VKVVSPYTAVDEQRLMTAIWDPAIAEDPEAFVMFVFPWGKENTPLANRRGPKRWQREELRNLRTLIQENKQRMKNGLPPMVDKFAMASGRGPGKSTLVAWVTLWAMSTILGGSVVLAANTEDQLKDKTMAELKKWHTLALNSHWFEPAALSLRPAAWFGELLKSQLKIDTTYYYAKAQLWSEENPDAFAGLHNQYGTFLIFDEASGIPAPIWKVSEGFFTDLVLHRYHWVFSNPRRNTGPFFECFHKLRNRWRTRQIDSREVEDIDQAVLAAIIEDHGEDSDTARIEVKGQFPRQGDKQFISNEIVSDSIQRELIDPKDPSNASNPLDNWAPLIMGVDPARFGDDCSVIRFRQGRNARVIPPIKLKNVDNMTLANRCAELIQKYDPDAVCIDAGNGTGVIDRLRELRYKVHEVWFGAQSPKPQWADQRTALWAEMRDWLRGACIDADADLRTDLTAPEYFFVGSSDVIRLESKEQMKDRGFASPDNGDALACTFAVKVAPRNLRTSAGQGSQRKARIADGVDYRVLE
jgi:hypothetical protein